MGHVLLLRPVVLLRVARTRTASRDLRLGGTDGTDFGSDAVVRRIALSSPATSPSKATYEAARDNTALRRRRRADLCGVAASAVTVEISEARRRRLAEGIVVTYTGGRRDRERGSSVTSAISWQLDSRRRRRNQQSKISGLVARFRRRHDDQRGYAHHHVVRDDGSSDGNGGATPSRSAGIIGGAVAGVAVLAAIGVGAYVYMRSKNSWIRWPKQAEDPPTRIPADEAAAPPLPPPPPTGRSRRLRRPATGLVLLAASSSGAVARSSTSNVHYRTVGLGKGQYACPKPAEYDWCVNYPSSDSAAWRAPVSSAAVAAATVIYGLLSGRLM